MELEVGDVLPPLKHTATVMQLFRYSAVTWNPHRIHFDQSYASREGIADRVTFETASAKDFPGEGYELITIFDALHDMGDPVGAASYIRQRLAADGVFMLVEPNAADDLTGNLNPLGRMFYSASTMI